MITNSGGFCVLPILSLAALFIQRATADITLPPIHGQFDYQIGGPYTPNSSVTIVDRDMSVEPASGVYSICYNAIEPDNLDSYTRSKKLITKAANLEYAKLLAAHAHSQNLAFGQKNDASITKAQATDVGFDFGIVEECQEFKECDKYDAVYGDQWIEIEYTDVKNATKIFKAACAARGDRISLIQRDRDVVKPTSKKYVYKICPSTAS